MFMAGCAINYPKPKIDRNLPVVTQLRTLSDMDEVGLEWNPVHQEHIKGYHIYRSSGSKDMVRIKTINDRYASHFADKKLKPNTLYSYTISTYSKSGFESVKSPIVNIRTKPRLEAIPFVQAITNLPRRVKIIWRPHPFGNVSSYVVQKRKIGKKDWWNEEEVKGRLSAEYIDLDLDDNTAFEYRVLAKTNSGLLSEPSQIVSAKTKPLPLLVQHVQATNNIPKKITVTWDRVANPDIIYYKVYSSPTSMLLYTYIAKTKNTKFDDLIKSNGATRYYKVTAVDKDGLESLKQSSGVQGQTLGAPMAPNLSDVKLSGWAVNLRWLQGDTRASSYMIIKKHNGKKEVINNITQQSYTDSNIRPNTEYSYVVVAVDKYGLQSSSSNALEVRTPKGNYEPVNVPRENVSVPKENTNVQNVNTNSIDVGSGQVEYIDEVENVKTNGKNSPVEIY